MKRKATTWNYCYPDDPHPGLIHLEPPALSGVPSFWIQCGGGTSEDQDETARRVAALWNATAELELDTEQIERGIIDDAFTALKEKVDEELYASYMKEMIP